MDCESRDELYILDVVETIRRYFNNAEAEFARSLLVSVGIGAVLAEENANTLGPGFAPGGVRLQVPDEDAIRAMEILGEGHEEFAPLPDEFVPPEEVSGGDEAVSPKYFHPADNDLKRNPALPTNNSPWPFFSSMFLLAGIVTALYFIFSTAVHVSQPVLDFSKGQVLATAEASNHTAKPVTLTLRFDIGYLRPNTMYSPGFYRSLAHREIVTSIEAHSSRRVSCEFYMPQHGSPNTASVKIISRK